MAWTFEEPLPFVPTGVLSFSPIFRSEGMVYIIDEGTNFWSYNISTRVWTELTSPNYGCKASARSLVPDDMDNPTMLFCISEDGVAGFVFWEGLRISTYNIALDTWADSDENPYYDLRLTGVKSGAFNIGEEAIGAISGGSLWVSGQAAGYIQGAPRTSVDFVVGEVVTGAISGQTVTIGAGGIMAGGGRGLLRSLVYVNANLIYAWVGRHDGISAGSCNRGRCLSFNPTTGAFNVFSAADFFATFNAFSAAINNLGTIVFGGIVTPGYITYTIATDTLAAAAIGAGNFIVYSHDSDKLWYLNYTDYRQGYLDVNDLSEHDNVFTENTERDPAPYSQHYGVRHIPTAYNAIIVNSRATPPELMSEGGFLPTVQTDPATGVVNNSAQLNATLDTGGLICRCRFEWGETIAYGQTTPWQSIAADGPFLDTAYPLKPNTTYYFRAIATNDLGTSTGAQRSFTTAQVPHYLSTILPEVDTRPATLITEHAARLNGIVVEDGGVIGDTRFQWGLNANYGTNTPWQQGYIKGSEFFVDLTNLGEGEAFHFRAQFRVGGKVVNGADASFNTLSPLGPVTLVTDEIIQLLGAV